MTQNTSKHQAFARAYRPQVFSEVVGQQHVLQALSYSLDQQNLHHAYLLTGTRGVGKTTLGRIFAKALNCENGISSSPCGICSACESIAAGRFVDLIEVDGASNTKVEDTRELLEDVQFVPTQGRFKIYLIDEVHMLSTHSFNALLKTLEEPPEHVKFILATTDPQKLPITVLSRCLQFHLQLLPVPLIQKHLEYVLQQESIEFETRALYLLAEAAQGSMRDALTLADQARSQGQGSVFTETVVSMLGVLDQRVAHQLLLEVLTGSAQDIFNTLQHVESTGADSDQILKDLLELCHQTAIAQALGEDSTRALFADPSLCQSILDLAQKSSAAQIQLCFETLLHARKTLVYASSPNTAVRMALLRMACFQSFSSEDLAIQPMPEPTAEQPILEEEKKKPIQSPLAVSPPQTQPNPRTRELAPVGVSSAEKPTVQHTATQHLIHQEQMTPAPTAERRVPTEAPPPSNDESQAPEQCPEGPINLLEAQNWFQWVKRYSSGGLFGQLLYNSRLTEIQQKNHGWEGKLIVSNTIFSYDPNETPKQVSQLLSKVLGAETQIHCCQAEHIENPPSKLRIQEQEQQRAAFVARVESSPFVTKLNQQMSVSLHLETSS